MATPWIQVYSNIIAHPKTHNLSEELELKCAAVKPNVVAAGLVVSLWCWAAQNAVDGDLTGLSAAAIADAAGWRKKPKTFYDAMVKVGFIDESEDGVQLHDWMEYAWLLHEQTENRKENDRKRAKNYRDRKKAQSSQQNHGDASRERHGDEAVSVTQSSQQNHAPTIPNHTIPNHSTTQIGRKDIDSTSISERHRDDPPELPAWVNDPSYIPTNAQIEAIPVFSVRMELIKRRRAYLQEHPERLEIERSKG